MLKVLFVDDDLQLLSGLRRMLRHMRHEWKMKFCGSGQDALDILAAENFDVIVSDMRMPGMDGAELLTRVMDQYPHMIRIALSGQSSQEMIFKSVRPVHQYLSKPCDQDKLIETINQACGIHHLAVSPELKNLISRIDSLPSLPHLYASIVQELKSEDASIHSVAKIIAQDVGMTAQILKLVNSAFFGFFNRIEDPAQAASMLGLETLKSLVLSIEIFTMFEGAGFSSNAISKMWDHSMRVAAIAKKIAESEDMETEMRNSAFMAGFLHDIGILIIASKLPEDYKKIVEATEQHEQSFVENEFQVLGTSHADIGAYLMGLWGMSDEIVNCIAWHHQPSKREDTGFSTLTAVYVANKLDRHFSFGEDLNFDDEYLGKIGKADRLEQWALITQNTLREDVEA